MTGDGSSEDGLREVDWRFLGHITQRRLLAHGSEKCEKLTGILMDRFSMFLFFLFPFPVSRSRC